MRRKMKAISCRVAPRALAMLRYAQEVRRFLRRAPVRDAKTTALAHAWAKKSV